MDYTAKLLLSQPTSLPPCSNLVFSAAVHPSIPAVTVQRKVASDAVSVSEVESTTRDSGCLNFEIPGFMVGVRNMHVKL